MEKNKYSNSPIIYGEFKSKDGFVFVNAPKQFLIDNGVSETDINQALTKAILDEKSQAIENHIYANYPQKKQAQDNGWVQNFTTKLKAMGVADIETQIVAMASSFLSGKKMSTILKSVDDAIKPMYEKLVKVAVKSEWCYLCIQEGKKAIAENRNAVYPEFPKFD